MEMGDIMKWIGAGWVDDTDGLDGLGRYCSRSARRSHIIFRRDFGLGRVGTLSRRGGSGWVVVRALEIWIEVNLGRIGPLSGVAGSHAVPLVADR